MPADPVKQLAMRVGHLSRRVAYFETLPLKHAHSVFPFQFGEFLTFNNDATERELFAHTIPAGDLGITGFLLLDSRVLIANSTGVAQNVTYRLYLGASMLVQAAIAVANTGAANRYVHRLSFGLANAGLANSQIIEGRSEVTGAIGAVLTLAAAVTLGHGRNTGAVDTTIDVALRWTAQFGAANAALILEHLGTVMYGPFTT